MHQAMMYIFTFELRFQWHVSFFVAIAWDDLYFLIHSTLIGLKLPGFVKKALENCVSQIFCTASLINVCMSVKWLYILYSLRGFLNNKYTCTFFCINVSFIIWNLLQEYFVKKKIWLLNDAYSLQARLLRAGCRAQVWNFNEHMSQFK